MKTASPAQGRFHIGFRFRLRLGLALLCAIVASCRTLPPDIPRGEAVQLTVVKSASLGDGVKVRNMTPGQDAGVGGAGGAVVGATAGFGCGPFAFLCVPAFAMAGIAAGSLAGYGVGLAESRSREHVDQAQERLNRYHQTHDPLAALRSAMLERANARWKVAEGGAAISIQVELRELVILAMRDDRAALAARIWLTVETPEDRRRNRRTLVKQIDYQGPYRNLSAWIDSADDALDSDFGVVYLHLTDMVLSELGAY